MAPRTAVGNNLDRTVFSLRPDLDWHIHLRTYSAMINYSKVLFSLSFLLLLTLQSSAQGVGINEGSGSPDPSAILDVSSTTKGQLLPRMTTEQRDAIENPAQSLLIYNISSKCFEFYENGLWQAMTCATCPTPAQPSAITGSSAACLGSSLSYSIPNVSGVTYTWSFPSGWSQTSGGTTNSVQVTVGSGSGNVQVTPSNACGNGVAQTLAVTAYSTPAAPTAAAHVAGNAQIQWNWNTVSGATGYKWNTTNDYASATDNGLSTSYTQTGLNCGQSYNLYVWAYTPCGNSPVLTLTQSTSSCFTVVSFTSLGTTSWTAPSGVTSVDYLVVAGGGGGGGCGGGGGGGGVRTGTLSVTPGNSYTVTVGAGGNGNTGNGSTGSNSVFASITSQGGGGGGSCFGSANGASGGSGGGAGGTGSPGTGGAGTGGQGFAGGNTFSLAAGGGGGAGGAGGTSSSASFGGNGGPGLASSISGSTQYYGGGGGGGLNGASGTGGTGGIGGGGDGWGSSYSTDGMAGQANTGGGGGGTTGGGSNKGGNGGSGVVIIRY